MAVLVPQARGREDQVALLHRHFLALDRGEAALAFHHEARGARRMLVVGRGFARQDQLHADVDRGRRLHVLEAEAGIGEHEHAALGLFDRRQFARLEQFRADVGIAPDHRLGAA
ncbi:MAG: hypothetical protein V9G24_14165 [Rhodoblastus sp.]